MQKLILASASPRRSELLALLPYAFEVIPSDAEENMDTALTAQENVISLARRKAHSVAAVHPKRTVIGCDTVVVLDGHILGKPRDAKHAGEMLRALSGRAHTVCTGVCIVHDGEEVRFCEETAVQMRTISERELAWYLNTGDPMDKAGAYGIQGHAGAFVERIDGDYFNVVGLPLCRLSTVLSGLGYGSFANT